MDSNQPKILSVLEELNKRLFPRLSKTPLLHYLVILNRLPDTYGQFDDTKLYGRRFWFDRVSELKEYSGKNWIDLLRFYLKYGFPHRSGWGERFNKNNPEMGFDPPQYSPTPEELVNIYERRAFVQINRMMWTYHRYEIAQQYIELTGEDVTGTSLLDYGCGVADPSVYLGVHGADVTVVDISGTVDFASWRLDKREIEHSAVTATQTEKPVELDETFQLVIMNEFLEHVRNPLLFLEMVIDKLEKGGLFYDAFGREYTHTVYASHLKEAKQIAESEEYKDTHRNHFELVEEGFYRKR